MNKHTFLTTTVLIAYTARAQNVGINTPNPGSPLTVVPNALYRGVLQKSDTTELGFYTNANGLAYVQTWNKSNLYLATGDGAPQVTLAYANKFVGINTASPQPNWM